MLIPAGSDSVVHSLLRYGRLWEILILGTGIALIRSGAIFPGYTRLQRKGLDLALAGKPGEAERCYRSALDMGAKLPQSDRVRLLVCLGDALIDQGRYDEAKQCLTQALSLGDPTGSGQSSMCDVLLAQKDSPQKALEVADEAEQLLSRTLDGMSFGARWAAVSKSLLAARTLARKARALVMLDRRTEARQALDRALCILADSKSEFQEARPRASLAGRLAVGDRLVRMKQLTLSDTYWNVGLSLLAIGDKDKAVEEFIAVRDTDRVGKYRSLAQKQLESLGYPETAPVLA